MNRTPLPTFFVQEDKILINKLETRFIEGDVTLIGSVNVVAPSTFETLTVSDVFSAKRIEAETIRVKNLITDWEFQSGESSTNNLSWRYEAEDSLEGKGLTWQHGEVSKQLLYRVGGNLWTNANFSLSESSALLTDQLLLLDRTTLGKTVVNSSLKELGTLTSLTVAGQADFQAKVKIQKLEVDEINSYVAFNNTAVFNNDVSVKGTLNASSLCIDKVLDKSGKEIKIDEYRGSQETDLYGKGLTWSYEDRDFQFVYGSNERIWTNLNLDIGASNSYKINNVPVLTSTELGAGIVTSNLKKVGTLRDLSVSGNASFGEFAFFNGDMFRVGLGTETPDAALHIHDFGVDIILGSQEQNTASIGLKTYHDLNIITDNTTRILIKNSGEVVFGNQSSKNANVTIFGTLKVDNLIADTRMDRYSPLEFKASADTRVYGLGLQWSDFEKSRSFLIMPNPERIVSSEHLEVAESKSYYVNGNEVLSEHSLGVTVTNSSLTNLGILTSLEVSGNANFINDVNVSKLNLLGPINSERQVALKVGGENVYFADAYGISIGNNQNTSKPVKIFGPLSVGVNNPDPKLGFTVAGDVSLGGKKFVSGDNIPTEGIFNKGDICWNTNPTPGNFVGWICLTAGSPGQWTTFGPIS